MKININYRLQLLLKFIIALVSFGTIGLFSIDIITDILAAFGNSVIGLFDNLSYLKFFAENKNLILFFKYENSLNINPQFSYVVNEVQTHFVFPNVMFIALILATNLEFRNKMKKLIIGLSLVNFLFVTKFTILACHNGLKQVILDGKGNLVELIDGTGLLFKLFDLFNNIFNKYGSIGIRPLVVLLIWAMLCFKFDELKILLIQPKRETQRAL